ncbi:Eogt, partial [Symbiodinium sp. CCMP2456]
VWPTKLSLPKASLAALQDDASSLCDQHWTWSGISQFWHEKSSKTGRVKWSIQRSGAPAAGGTVTAESALGVLCSHGSFAPKSAVVVVQSPDRFSANLWHRMAVVFEAWVVPRVLQLKEKLPGEISISYHVPRLKNITVETDPGPFPWQLLGPVAPEDCGYEHHILAPSDGFLWDLAWDLPLTCVHASNLWRSFQSALYTGVGLDPETDFGGRRVCYVGRPGRSTRQLSDKSFHALKEAAERMTLDGQSLVFRSLGFNTSMPIQQQAKMVSGCDILVGMHGAGMMHSIWMYPGSVVVEIMDQEHERSAYYRNVAHLSGHVYLRHNQRELGENPEVFWHLMISATEIISNKGNHSRHASFRKSQ